jgi:hypothetical protein
MKTAKPVRYFALLLPILAFLAGPSLRAAEKSDWSSLKQIAAGQTIKVTVKNAPSSLGDFETVTDDALVLRVAGEERRIPRDTVRRVSLKVNRHRGRHALKGALTGATTGLNAGMAIDSDCAPNSIVCTGIMGAAILTPGFALVGAGIGALLPAGGWRDIYRAR